MRKRRSDSERIFEILDIRGRSQKDFSIATGILLKKGKKIVPVVSFVLYFGTTKRYEKILSNSDEICEVNTMCEVVDRLVNMGKREGRAEGREEGRREELQRLVEIKLAKGKTIEQIADELELSMAEVGELIQSFQL